MQTSKLILLLALATAALAQTTTTPAATAPCAAGTDVGYTYSGSALIGYNSPLGSGVAAGSAFGVKVGSCSKAVFEAAVWTGLTGPAKQTGYSMFTGRFEYDLVKQGNFVFGGDGTIGGAQVTGAAGTAMFQAGGHLGYDFGALLSKGKTSLYGIAHADYTYLTAPPVPNAVRENYWFEVRKTLK
jgi:hypothetical protein